MRKCDAPPPSSGPSVCPNHGDDAVCTACAVNGSTDGAGFPVIYGAWRRPLRQCPDCKQWVGPKLWMHDTIHAVFCCVDCMPAAYDRIAKHLESLLASAATAPKRVKLRDAIDKVRRRARSLMPK